MPRLVDHDARRREVTDVATEIIVSRGREALTVREVAEASGWSTTVVSHYFADVAELQHMTFTAATARAAARLEVVIAADPTDLRGLMESLLPLDHSRRRDWRVWLAFWNEALTVQPFADDQRERARMTTLRLGEVLRLLRAADRLACGIEIPRAAARLGALIPGIAVQALFDPTRWTAACSERCSPMSSLSWASETAKDDGADTSGGGSRDRGHIPNGPAIATKRRPHNVANVGSGASQPGGAHLVRGEGELMSNGRRDRLRAATPDEVEAVVSHPNPHLRANLVADPYAPLTMEQVAVLADDPSPSVRANLVRSRRDLTRDQLVALADDPSELVRSALITSDHHLGRAQIARLVLDSHERVRSALARSDRPLSGAQRAILAADTHWTVRRSLAS